MIYGANGYTGRLIVAECYRLGLKPVLAGRNPMKLAALEDEFECESCSFDLKNAETAAGYLANVDAVIHCAGPFSETANVMLEACMLAKTHYLDITGEIDVFEMIHQRSPEIAAAGICAIPGVGFDVVPTDCLAAMLKRKLPDATHLELAFHASETGLSVGTAKTALANLGQGTRIREHGRIKSLPPGRKTRLITFDRSPHLAVSIPWGDVSTAYYSTGIPNVDVYMPITPAALRVLRLSGQFAAILSSRPVVAFMQWLAGYFVKGPGESMRKSRRIIVWGQVSQRSGKMAEMRMEVPDGYAFTAELAVRSVQEVLRKKNLLGALTPSQAFGADYIRQFDGVKIL